MSFEILVQDLHRKSRERIRALWQEAELEAEAFRSEKRNILEEEQKAVRGRLKEIRQEAVTPVLLEAEKESLRIRDVARKRLADRLQSLSSRMLGQLRSGDYGNLFACLAAELPEMKWQKVWVNPLDQELAGHFFPDAEIVGSKEVIGGFEALDETGEFRVISTLEKRFERAFPYILPILLKTVLERENAAAAC